MNRIIAILVLTFPLLEAYSFFPKGVLIHPFPLRHEYGETIRWFVSENVDNILWVITMISWRISLDFRQPERDEFGRFLVLFIIHRCIVLVVYNLNANVPGIIQLIVYIPILFYGSYIIYRSKYSQLFEWVYAKWQKIRRNGNNRGTP